MSSLKEKYLYTPFFCEENIWQLAKSLIKEGESAEDMQVLFLSNERKQISLFRQIQSNNPNKPTVWDYHVILQVKYADGIFIYDFDSRLPFPSPADKYFQYTLPDPRLLPAELSIYLRRIPADSFLKQFYSTRQHMRGNLPEDEFPDYPPLTNEPGVVGIPLQDYWDMTKELSDDSVVSRFDYSTHQWA